MKGNTFSKQTGAELCRIQHAPITNLSRCNQLQPTAPAGKAAASLVMWPAQGTPEVSPASQFRPTVAARRLPGGALRPWTWEEGSSSAAPGP